MSSLVSEPSSPPTPPPLPRHRPLPKWAWIVAILFFPPGPFIACGAARLVSWTWAIVLAILSFATSQLAIDRLMHLAPSTQDEGSDPFQLATRLLQSGPVLVAGLAGVHLIVIFWACIFYRIGKRVSYWSPWARNAWRGSAWLAAVLFVLLLLIFALLMVSDRLQPAV